MNPILSNGDGLQVVPYEGQKIRRGDVIVFLSPDREKKVITHRVVSVDSRGIRTRGDNNKLADPWTLSPSEILGRVVYAQRNKRRVKIFGGLPGILISQGPRFFRFTNSALSYLLRPAYYRLLRVNPFSKWLHRRINPRIYSFERPRGTEFQLLIGGLVIGKKWPGSTRWRIRPPFRLIVDEASLPKN